MADTPQSPFAVAGRTGLKRHGGWIDEEFQPELRGSKAIEVYREMGDSSPIVGAILYAIKELSRQVEIRVEAGGESPEDERAQELIETCLDDMSTSWDDTLSDILSFLQYGWSYHEIVYKARNGPNRQPGMSSQYADGLIGWRKLPIRSQDSLWEWVFDPDDGGIRGMIQQPPPDYNTYEVPIEKALLFRPEAFKGNPEGRSILRSAWPTYYRAKRIGVFEAIGIERELNGLPVAKIPAGVIDAGGTAYNDWKNTVVNIRADEQGGLVIPSDTWQDAQGNPTQVPKYTLELLSVNGRRAIDTNAVIGRLHREIAMSVLADFLFIGQTDVGSFSLVSSRTTLFATALGTILENVASPFNRHAIPRLMALNNFHLEAMPRLVFGDIESVDLKVLSEALKNLSDAGLLTWDAELEQWLRQAGGLPELTDDQMQTLQDERQTQRNGDQQAAQDEFSQMQDMLARRGSVTTP